MRLILFILSFSIVLSGAVPAKAVTPLYDDPVLREGFYKIGLAEELRRNCPRIAPKLVRAYAFLKELEKYAMDAGYSRDDFKQAEGSLAQKPDMRAQIEASLSQRGVRPGDSDSYCAVGRQEIARGTQIGEMLEER